MDFTEESESPTNFHFWTGVATIAGALRRQVWIKEGHFEWTPNFYIILVAPPGIAAKSTSISIGMRLLGEIDSIKWGPTSMTWQGLTRCLTEAMELVPFGPPGEYLAMSCITCKVRELGTFLRPSDRELVDVLVDLWDGEIDTWKRTLKGEGDTVIENPWLNIIAATTPAWLEDNFPEVMIGGGLTSRIIFVYGDTKRKLIPYPSQVMHQDFLDRLGISLIDDLHEISKITGQYTLTPEALAWGTQWYAEHWSKTGAAVSTERYGGYRARKQTHMHKLAMVMAASRRDELTITLQDLQESNAMIEDIEPGMQKVFTSIGVSEISKHMKELMSHIHGRERSGIDGATLWGYCLMTMGLNEYDEALKGCIRAGMVRSVAEQSGHKYYPTKQETENAPSSVS